MRKNYSVYIIIGLVMMLILSGCAKKQTQEEENVKISYKEISQKEAKEMMDAKEEIIILDVREEEEFADGHITDAVLLPVGEILKKAEEVLPDKEKKILVYCRSGRRSKIASQELAELGYTNVYEFGGIIDWDYEIVK